jgi:hypothetical protein
MSSFQLVGLPYQSFAPLFERSDAELEQIRAQRVFATAAHGYPCRVSLRDAELGEELLLLPYEHQSADSPYRASGPIFVRRAAIRASLAPDVIPDYVARRLMSVRAYDAHHQMTDAAVCPGAECAPVIRRMFDADEVAYIHLHNANRGCFSCEVKRA